MYITSVASVEPMYTSYHGHRGNTIATAKSPIRDIRNTSPMALDKNRRHGVLTPLVAPAHHTITTQATSQKMDTSTRDRMSSTLHTTAQHLQFRGYYDPITLRSILDKPTRRDNIQSSMSILPVLRLHHRHHHDIPVKALNDRLDITTRDSLLHPPIHQDPQHQDHQPPKTSGVSIKARLCRRNAIGIPPQSVGVTVRESGVCKRS